MSIKVIAKIWDSFPNGGTELLALLALADWSDDEGRCFPSINAIAKKTRLSRSQAQRVVHALIDQNFVKVIGNPSGGAPGSSRKYQILINQLTGSVNATRRNDAQEGPHGCAETGSTHATLTVIEPSLTTNAQFAEFWANYPRKKNKGDAEKAFKALKVSDALMETMLSAIETAKLSSDWLKCQGQYIPYPASWLRNKGWEDEPQGAHALADEQFAGAI